MLLSAATESAAALTSAMCSKGSCHQLEGGLTPTPVASQLRRWLQSVTLLSRFCSSSSKKAVILA